MPRATNRLSTRSVAAAKEPGMHADGGGLYLRVTKAGSRQWVFVYQFAGKRCEMGLGSADPKTGVGVADARTARDSARAKLAGGDNPAAKAVAAAVVVAPTFGKLAMALVDDLESGWKNEKHRQQWRNSLKAHAAALWELTPAEITTEHLADLLRPIWHEIPETADRVRGRVERVLDAARVRGLITGPWENPARWRGHLQMIMPQKKKLSRGHHLAMPYGDVPAFLAELRGRPAMAARCLEFTVLTTVRSGEAYGARWAEIDLAEKLWTIPAARMKAGAEHRVPLVGRALELVRDAYTLAGRVKESPDSHLFPSEHRGRPLSIMAMEMLLRRMGYGDRVSKCKAKMVYVGAHPNYTVHGFRSSFRDWAGDETEFAEEIVEQALAHTVGSKVRRAYRRGDALDKRRELMLAWDAFSTRPALKMAAE
jgi:integrase